MSSIAAWEIMWPERWWCMRVLTVKSTIFFNTPTKTEFALHQAAGLTLQEAELIETFLARRLEIPPEVRRFNGQRIADMISARLNIPPESRPADNENFLELTVREFRSRAQYR